MSDLKLFALFIICFVGWVFSFFVIKRIPEHEPVTVFDHIKGIGAKRTHWIIKLIDLAMVLWTILMVVAAFATLFPSAHQEV